MIELRYYSERNEITSEQVKNYSKENQLSLMQAKEMLLNATKPRLQFRQKIDVTVRAGMWDNASIERTANYQWSEWTDVPSVTEIRESVSSQRA